jgi:hypothetical protein
MMMRILGSVFDSSITMLADSGQNTKASDEVLCLTRLGAALLLKSEQGLYFFSFFK